MLRVLAVLGITAEQLESGVAGLAHKTHQRPAVEENGWASKIFGCRTPQDLTSVAQRFAVNEDTTSVVAIGFPNDCVWLQINRSEETILKIIHPTDWLLLSEPSDRWEFCIEEFGDPEESRLVAGIDPRDKTLQFLWDHDEAKLVNHNLIPNNEPGFCQKLIKLCKEKGFPLPADIEAKALKSGKVDRVFSELFKYQKNALSAALKKAKIKTDRAKLARCFNAEDWEGHWVDSNYGNFPGLLSAIGIDSLANGFEETHEDDFAGELNRRKTFKSKTRNEKEFVAWETIYDRKSFQPLFESMEHSELLTLEPPLQLTTNQLGYLLRAVEILDEDTCWLLEVDLPSENFELADGSTFDWSRLHSRDHRALEVIRLQYEGRKFVWAIEGAEAFFPNPQGEAKFLEQAHRFDSGYPLEARVPLHRFLERLPDETKLSLYMKSPFQNLPITTMGYRGVVKDGQFLISQYYPDIPRAELEMTIKHFKQSHAKNVTASDADFQFKQKIKGKYWDLEPYRPKLIAKRGSLRIKQAPELGRSPIRRVATLVEKYTKDFERLGFQYVGALVMPKLGPIKIMCFTGPADIDAHIVLEGTIRPEFWTRFESGDVLTTNTSDFFGANTNHPKAGLYYRTYYDRPLSKLLKKHKDGIARFAEHKNTQPIEHQPELEAFVDNIFHFVGRHPDFNFLLK